MVRGSLAMRPSGRFFSALRNPVWNFSVKPSRRQT